MTKKSKLMKQRPGGNGVGIEDVASAPVRVLGFSLHLSVIAVLACIVLLPEKSFGDTISSVSVNGQYQQCSDSGAAAAACQVNENTSLGGGTVTFVGTAGARSSYGDLGTDVSWVANCNGITAPSNCYSDSGPATAMAQFGDTFEIQNGPSSGALLFSALADGTSGVTCVASAPGNDANVAFICGNSPFNTILSVGGGSSLIDGSTGDSVLPNGSTLLTIAIPFVGSSVAVDFAMQSSGRCLVSNEVNCNGFTNFYNTFLITGVSVEDSSGVLDPNAIVLSASGTDYDHIGSVPEPSSILMIGSGLALLAFVRRLHRAVG